MNLNPEMKNKLIIEEVYSSHCKCELCKLIDGTQNLHLKKNC